MRRNKLFRRVFYNWQVKVICFLLAVFMYFFLGLVLQDTRTIKMPLEVVLPEGYTADSNVPTSVNLLIKGTQDRIYMVDVDDVRVSVDFSEVDHEGVNTAPVVIDVDGASRSLDLSSVSISTDPTQVKIYFSTKDSM